MEVPEVYVVEVDTEGCEKCGSGRHWRVVGPDDVSISMTFGEIEDAEWIADNLNAAYYKGRTARG